MPLNCGWLKKLKPSNRNDTARDSLKWIFLNSARSQLLRPGPRTIPFAASPKVATGGTVNAAVLNQLVRVLGPDGFPIRFGRSRPPPIPSLSVVNVTVEG